MFKYNFNILIGSHYCYYPMICERRKVGECVNADEKAGMLTCLNAVEGIYCLRAGEE